MKLTNEVYMAELSGGNAYFIRGTRHILIDTGMPGRSRDLFIMLEQILTDTSALDEVLLTHHDVDHIGNLYEVQKKYSAYAYISSEDMPYVTGRRHRPGIKRMIELVLKPRTPVNLLPLEHYSNPEIRVIPTPGHTPGHTIFQFQEFLFTGDLFHTEKGHITPTKRIMNWDNRILSNSIGKLLEIDAKLLCPSHGSPVTFSQSIKKELKEIGDFYAGR